jgi:hypothetical protein
MMDRYIADVLDDLSRRGIRIKVRDDESLFYDGPPGMTEREIEFIRHHKTQIIKFLNAQPRGVVIEFADHYVPF